MHSRNTVAILLLSLLVLMVASCGKEQKTNTPEYKENVLRSIRDTQRMPKLDSLYFEHEMGNGIAYVDLDVGEGIEAKEGDLVTVNYVLWLSNGRRLDNSLDRIEPFDFTIGKSRVIQGWHEGIKGMRVGDKRFMKIPSELGYGENGRGRVPPNATLYFYIEVLDIR